MPTGGQSHGRRRPVTYQQKRITGCSQGVHNLETHWARGPGKTAVRRPPRVASGSERAQHPGSISPTLVSRRPHAKGFCNEACDGGRRGRHMRVRGSGRGRGRSGRHAQGEGRRRVRRRRRSSTWWSSSRRTCRSITTSAPTRTPRTPPVSRSTGRHVKVNGLYNTPGLNGQGTLLTNNPNTDASGNQINPRRLDPANINDVLVCDQDHDYNDEQKAFDGGKMDKFPTTVAPRRARARPGSRARRATS